MEKIVIKHHPDFISFLRENGLAVDDVCSTPNATQDDVRGKHVIITFSFSSVESATIIAEIPVNATLKFPGKAFNSTTLCKGAGKPIIYKMNIIHLPMQDTIKDREEQTTFSQKKSQNGRCGIVLIGPKTAWNYSIEIAHYGQVWMGYSYEDAGTVGRVKVYRLVQEPGKFVLAAFRDITPLKGCYGVSLGVSGNSSISVITGDLATAIWRQWGTKRRSSILMHLDKSGKPCKIEAHEAVEMGPVD